MIDIKEAFTRGELVLGVNPLQTPYGQKHSNGGTPGKEYVRLETELWVIDSDLSNSYIKVFIIDHIEGGARGDRRWG